jgi:hypothetical protein
VFAQRLYERLGVDPSSVRPQEMTTSGVRV